MGRADFKVALGHGAGHRQAQRLPIQTALAEKLALTEDGDYRLLSLLRRHDKFDLALADVKDSIRRIAESELTRVQKREMVRVLHAEPTFAEMFMTHLLTRNGRIEEDLVDQLFN